MMRYFVVVILLWANSAVAIQPSVGMAPDSEGFLLGRYPGAALLSQHHNPYIESVVLTALNSIALPEVWGQKEVVGENTVAIYALPKSLGESAKTVFLSLAKHLGDKGATSFISCSAGAAKCGYYFPRRLANSSLRQSYYAALEGFSMLNDSDFYFYSGAVAVSGEQYYVSVIVSSASEAHIQYSVDILRLTPGQYRPLISGGTALEQDIEVEQEINATGSAVLAGLHFNSDSTELTAASSEALERIAVYLKSEVERNFFVVGHTDSEGDEGYNAALSKGRADAVVKALVSQFQLPAQRLQAVGLGHSQPIASNSTSLGRAENRRVELVLIDSERGALLQQSLTDRSLSPSTAADVIATESP